MLEDKTSATLFGRKVTTKNFFPTFSSKMFESVESTAVILDFSPSVSLFRVCFGSFFISPSHVLLYFFFSSQPFFLVVRCKNHIKTTCYMFVDSFAAASSVFLCVARMILFLFFFLDSLLSSANNKKSVTFCINADRKLWEDEWELPSHELPRHDVSAWENECEAKKVQHSTFLVILHLNSW